MGAKSIVYPFTPQETQAEAARLMNPYSKKKIIGYGGPKFGGKSWTIQYISSLHMLSRPVSILIIGHKYEDMKSLHVEPLKRLLKDYIDEGLVSWHATDKKFTCHKYGSTIKFQQIANDSDARSLNGQRHDIVLIDEAQKLTPWSLTYLPSVCGFSPTASDWQKRLTIQFKKAQAEGNLEKQAQITKLWENTLYKPKMLYCFNWGEKGHTLLRRWFWDGCKHEGDPYQRLEKYKRDEETGIWLEDPADFHYIFADMKKNIIGMESDPAYEKRIKAMEEPYRTAYLTGNPDAFSGLKYEIHPHIHEIDFDEYLKLRGYHDGTGTYIPDNWYLYGAIDSGVTTAASLYVRTHDGKSFQISDYYQENDERSHIREIVAEWKNNPWTRGRMPDIVFGDRYMFAAKSGRGLAGNELTWKYILEEEHGLFCYQVISDRVTAAKAVGVALHYETDKEGSVIEEPLLYFAKKATGERDGNGYMMYQRFGENTINEVVSLESDPKRPEDIKHGEGIPDHAFDKLKIYLMGMSAPPQIPADKKQDRTTDEYGFDEKQAYDHIEDADYEDVSGYGDVEIGSYGE